MANASNLHFSDARDIDDFVEHLAKFERGEMTPEQFRVYRLGRGTYGQRQPDVSMLRIKIPQGVLNSEQLEAIAHVADEFSRGLGHVTTRQNIQLHFVQLSRVPAAMRSLDAAGLTTKEACGNTVRNVTACPLAGVCTGAPFDVTGYGRAITRHFLRNPVCQSLPRKFKVGLSGCANDCVGGAINDVGLVARVDAKTQRRGFRVRVGGGLSTSPEDAHPLEEFVPTERLLPTLEAIVRVFDRLGNRENKSRARLKYVIRKLGIEGFRREYEEELASLAQAGRSELAIELEEEPTPDVVLRRREEAQAVDRAGYAEFVRTNCLVQRQPGYYTVIARLDRGDITSGQLRGAAKLARRYGEGQVRVSVEQNLLFRFIPHSCLPTVHAHLVELGLGQPGARTIEDVTACPGADTCNLAVTRSRGLSAAISARLREAEELRRLGESLDVKISGCPNSCGQHHVAALGFHGTMRRVDGRAAPEYQLHLGGGIEEAGATFGRQVVKIPARRVPEAVVRLLALYQRARQPEETPLAFFRRVEAAAVKEAIADLTELDRATAKPKDEDYLDYGDDAPFVVAIGQGECAS